jgi:hypothetical protein
MSESLTTMETNNEITKRIRVDYDITKQMIMKNSKNIVLLEIDNKKLTGESVIYDNQEECSLAIVSNLHNKKIINVMIVALTQSGKTGTMSGLIKNYLNDTTNLIPIENIYIITGLSSRDWVEQTTNRMPKSIQERVFHRDNLTNKFVDDIKNKKNVLIIIDEIQIAAKENQTLYKAFNDAGFYNKQNLLNNDIKIIEFTATPDGTIYDLMNWGENAFKIKMEPGQGYTSCFDLKNQKRVFQYKDLCGYDKKSGDINEELVAVNILELKSFIDKYGEPLYHIIRTPNGYLSDVVIDNIKKYINEDIKYYTYDKESDIEDINKFLEVKPEQHTYIFIKEKLRCAKTLHKKYLGAIYERYTKSPDDAVVIQGLIGRGTGYDDNGKSIYFTNIPSIEKYEKLWNSNFEDKSIKWKSKTTKRKNDLLHSTGTYNNPSLIDGMSVSSEESNEEHEPVIKKFKTQEEVKQYYDDELKSRFGGRGPIKRKPNENGYYTTNIGNSPDKIKPRTTDEIYDIRKFWLKTQKTPYRLYPCYEDVNDKSTLQFWIIHY